MIADAIGRVRRAMPRNMDVMAVCDECERLAAALRRSSPQPKVDRKTYMRNYMRTRRRNAVKHERAPDPR